MTYQEHWQKVLSDRVVSICVEEDVEETQCELIVREWLSQIQKVHRPTVAGVLMDAKRKLWGLTPI